MTWRDVCVWSGGFVCSTLLVWGLSAVFSNSIVPVEWDDELGLFVLSSGTVSRFRSEGWADTRIGKHGLTIAGERVLKGASHKMIIWGDSFAEAVQIDDSRRIANLFNTMSTSLQAFTVAGGGRGVADYYFDIPRYEKLADNIEGHVILIAGLDDVLPGRHVGCHSRFLSDPWRFEASACPPSDLSLRFAPFASRWKLEFLYALYRGMKDYPFRFTPGRVADGRDDRRVAPMEKMGQAWEFLVQSLKAQTSGFITFVYVPPGPFLQDGQVVTSDPEEALKGEFRAICESAGVGFIDMSREYADLYTRDGRLPRGFFNSPPGVGHLNEDGQRLIAERVHEFIEREGL